MAKNVIITEDGHPKTISNATRIRTALEGGGTCDWIPKDDVPLQELTVTEDGVYDPEEGYYGFSQVTANGVGTVVEGTLIEKTVTKNGTYNITDESGNPYGYSKITVNVDTSDDDSGGGSGGGGSNPVVGKDDDGNDTMAEADDDGNIVMTALPTEIKVIIPPTKLEYNRYEEIDYSGISVYAYVSKAIHWLGTTTTVISEGSPNSIVSIGGNSVTASIGDGVLYAPDRTGENDIQLVWDGTKWAKPSNYSAEKAIWKSDNYPTGRIPFEELIFPIKRINGAPIDEMSYNFDIGSVNYKIVKASSFSWTITWYYNGELRAFNTIEYRISGSYLGILVIRQQGKSEYTAYVISNTKENNHLTINSRDTWKYVDGSNEDLEDSSSLDINYSLYYTMYTGTGTKAINSTINIPTTVATGYINISNVSTAIIEKYKSGDYKKTASITLPVQWKRPGDGKILETTFIAWMTDDGDNNASAGNTRPGGPSIDVPQ